MAEGGAGRRRNNNSGSRNGPQSWEKSRVCKFYIQGNCYYGENCRFRHVNTSGRVMLEDHTSSHAERNDHRTPSQSKGNWSKETTLYPNNKGMRSKPASEYTQKHERRKKASAIQRSRDKACGICIEVVMEKKKGENKFGILPNCNHCFCLPCIRKWRRANDSEFDHEITRACPECRVSSDFVCSSFYWVESKAEKEKLIADYKEALSKKDCKYFTRRGRCPFGTKCFYKHPSSIATQSSIAQQPFYQQQRNEDDVFADHRRTIVTPASVTRPPTVTRPRPPTVTRPRPPTVTRPSPHTPIVTRPNPHPTTIYVDQTSSDDQDFNYFDDYYDYHDYSDYRDYRHQSSSNNRSTCSIL